jgi:hypothetical protein
VFANALGNNGIRMQISFSVPSVSDFGVLENIDALGEFGGT